MVGRRGFIGGVLGLALGSRSALMSSAGFAASDDTALRQYLVEVAACDVNVLGVPSNGSLVEKGLHPVARIG